MSNYAKGYQRENKFKHELERKGYLVFRSAGSHSFADLIALSPVKKCYKPDHFAVRFIQIKVDSDLKRGKMEPRVEETIIGPVNVEYHKFHGKRNGPRLKGRTKAKGKKEVLATVPGKGRGRNRSSGPGRNREKR